MIDYKQSRYKLLMGDRVISDLFSLEIHQDGYSRQHFGKIVIGGDSEKIFGFPIKYGQEVKIPGLSLNYQYSSGRFGSYVFGPLIITCFPLDKETNLTFDTGFGVFSRTHRAELARYDCNGLNNKVDRYELTFPACMLSKTFNNDYVTFAFVQFNYYGLQKDPEGYYPIIKEQNSEFISFRDELIPGTLYLGYLREPIPGEEMDWEVLNKE